MLILSYTSRTFRTFTELEGIVRLSICTFCSTTGLEIVAGTCPVQSNSRQPPNLNLGDGLCIRPTNIWRNSGIWSQAVSQQR